MIRADVYGVLKERERQFYERLHAEKSRLEDSLNQNRKKIANVKNIIEITVNELADYAAWSEALVKDTKDMAKIIELTGNVRQLNQLIYVLDNDISELEVKVELNSGEIEKYSMLTREYINTRMKLNKIYEIQFPISELIRGSV